jgi:predicted CXXCH cytochrome family protein
LRQPASSRRWAVLVATVLALAALGGYLVWHYTWRPPHGAQQLPEVISADYVGSAECGQCHARQFDAWQGSQHAAAMAEASERTVLGDFDNARFTYVGVTSSFFRRDGKFFVRTDGPDGRLAEFPVKYTFGVAPLQQYLIEFPDGRLQALSIAWDARAKERGGQRWFHLYPGQNIRYGDALHWTQLQQNWNFMCADCHSTRLRKNYDAAAARFHTSWSEINVGCEACHGPASNHLAWARKEGDRKRFDGPGRGLPVVYDERRDVAWTMNPDTGIAERSRARDSAREVTACAQCHSRRSQISEDHAPGRPIGDGYLVALLEEGLYWHDGQMRDEVYNHGSFLQSRMFAKGVTCSDCHDPHSGKLRADGNAVCGQCHSAPKYDAQSHHRHPQGSAGTQCAACHMPSTTYMVIDPRHDHSMRIPRPDLSVRLGTPNACNQCHADRDSQWAARAIQQWYGHAPGGYQTFAEAFVGASRHAAGTRSKLLAIAAGRGQPAIARASALSRLANDSGASVIEVAAQALNDDDELVRRAAIEVLSAADAPTRVRYLPRMVEDPVRAVRIEAARALAAVSEHDLPSERRAALSRALEEYVAVQTYNGDRPESHLNLGALYQERGDLDGAEAAYRQALKLHPGAVQPVINLADLYRARGDENAVEELLRTGLQANPRSAPLHHALGLAYARQQKRADSLRSLAAAARLAPDSPRYAYVYGVALHSYGEPARAIATLEQAHRRFTGDRTILQALASMERDRGNRARALDHAQTLVGLAPDDPQAQALLQSLRR